jgi:CRP-like cAMP-binding protein
LSRDDFDRMVSEEPRLAEGMQQLARERLAELDGSD